MTNDIEVNAIETQERATVLSQMGGSNAVERIKAISDAIDGAMKYALTKTKPIDWVKQGDKYYLQATGTQRVRSVFGIYFRAITISKETFDDGTYAYIVSGTAGSTLLNQLYGVTEIEIEGMRSSADGFFSGKDGKRAFDPMDVRKSAHANFQVRATTALLGLGGFTEKDVIRAGIDLKGVSKVDYKKGAEGGGNTNIISDKQLKRLIAIQNQTGCPDEVLKEHLMNVYKIKTRKDIPRDKYEEIVKWIEAGGTTDGGEENV